MLLAAAAALAAVGLRSLNALTAFNALVPKDEDFTRVIGDAVFGPHERQRLDVYRPANDDTTLPIFVHIYGGSWDSGAKDGYEWLGRAISARGFAVVIPDYRLTSHGRYPDFVEDCAEAVRWAIANASSFGGDPDRIVLSGHSAGAYNAAMLAFDPKWLGKDHKRIKGFIGLAGPFDFLPLDPFTRSVFGHVDDLPATQPVNFVRADLPPSLIATAKGDARVAKRNSDLLASALTQAGVPVIRRHYPDVGHVGIMTAIARPLRGRAPTLEDMINFAREVTAD